MAGSEGVRESLREEVTTPGALKDAPGAGRRSSKHKGVWVGGWGLCELRDTHP